MSTYVVLVREVWIQGVRIEAASPEEALRRVADGDGEYLEDRFEYSHTLGPECWQVEKEE